ncbi:16S rRNA (guanine(527)-N(7))-methyltransferase RsmG [Mesorhizobium sp. NBSH29]|uniref:16S rRNA (guanine(527)-N(7))-methyltransferase RsmG n=1 Tax=Mesorhizobium sp. NBSH29 TaxID=2654249 RepID=UPI0018964D97|nr:16S rRNA (guanine(527)-N(7))-methyltransferase RsmG [Mesorhizobium sp. NBSH29]QPC86070.1 16S rRNA (guanine(527)-N(7))-methyltransferase RsmG [Mesorhizobium sp. NBSH29]
MSELNFERLTAAAGPVSRETFEKLLVFETRFLHWAKRVNLVSSSTIPHLWSRHILDSAQLLSLAPEALSWVDLGSGGGFPGAVLAVLLADRPGAHIDLVESNRKKAAFLQSVLGELRAPARVHARRIEESHSVVTAPQIVTARALAPLSPLLALAEPWLQGEAKALFHKGRDYRSEIEESIHRWEFHLVEHVSIVDPDGAILEISRLKPRYGP